MVGALGIEQLPLIKSVAQETKGSNLFGQFGSMRISDTAIPIRLRYTHCRAVNHSVWATCFLHVHLWLWPSALLLRDRQYRHGEMWLIFDPIDGTVADLSPRRRRIEHRRMKIVYRKLTNKCVKKRRDRMIHDVGSDGAPKRFRELAPIPTLIRPR